MEFARDPKGDASVGARSAGFDFLKRDEFGGSVGDRTLVFGYGFFFPVVQFNGRTGVKFLISIHVPTRGTTLLFIYDSAYAVNLQGGKAGNV